MEVREVSPHEYRSAVTPRSIFNSVEFNELNKYKVNNVYYLLFIDSKVRLGLILGEKNGFLFSPYSSPYGGFDSYSSEISVSVINAGIKSLENWAINRSYKEIFLMLPPIWIEPSLITKYVNLFFINGYSTNGIEINHHFEINENFTNCYLDILHRNAKKNLKNSLKSDLEFRVLEQKDAHLSFNIIALNRSAKGKPLRMSLSQIQQMESLIQVDYFLVTHHDNSVASAIVFHVGLDFVQVVYWGDNPEFSELRAMNFLSYKVFEYYQKLNINRIDIGPSTENSIPNVGLCDFKESIGCKSSLKFSFKKTLDVCH